jgi:predicted glycoside hydrolase/deacetylase ChbG (UPF0249 family)
MNQGRKLIINADDFGLSIPVNKAIIKAHREGILTSASLMVNMPGFGHAVSLIKENTSLSVGIHINIFRGKPVSLPYKIKSLCKGETFIENFFEIMRTIFYKKIELNEFEIECRLQVEKAFKYGITISHLDSEKHIHLIPLFFETIIKIAKEYKILRIRCINEMPYNFLNISPANLFNIRFYSLLYHAVNVKKEKKLLEEQGFKTTDYFYGLLKTGGMGISEYKRILSHLKRGTTEIMCHPGHSEAEGASVQRRTYYQVQGGELELKALLDPRLKDLIASHNIILTNYSEL